MIWLFYLVSTLTITLSPCLPSFSWPPRGTSGKPAPNPPHTQQCVCNPGCLVKGSGCVIFLCWQRQSESFNKPRVSLCVRPCVRPDVCGKMSSAAEHLRVSTGLVSTATADVFRRVCACVCVHIHTHTQHTERNLWLPDDHSVIWLCSFFYSSQLGRKDGRGRGGEGETQWFGFFSGGLRVLGRPAVVLVAPGCFYVFLGLLLVIGGGSKVVLGSLIVVLGGCKLLQGGSRRFCCVSK